MLTVRPLPYSYVVSYDRGANLGVERRDIW